MGKPAGVGQKSKVRSKNPYMPALLPVIDRTGFLIFTFYF
jgi:hypothetical protein